MVGLRGLLRSGHGVVLLLALFLTDSGFVLAHTLHKLSPYFADAAFALDTERGYAELFQYLKLGVAVLLVGTVWARTHEPVYGAWTLLLAYAFCDDAFQVHERAGALVAEAWHYKSALGLRARDFGELTVSGAAGATLVSAVLLAHVRSGPHARSHSRSFMCILAGLVFFGVVIDMAHVAVDGSARYVTGALGIAEDGGEMLVVSVMCWYASTRLPYPESAHGRLHHQVA